MNKLYNLESQYECSKTKEVFSYLIVFMMLGNVYLFPLFTSLDLGEILLIIFIPYFLIHIKKITLNRRFSLIYLFLGYSLFITLAMVVFLNGNVSNVFSRMVRDLFYYFIVFFLGYHLFDLRTFKKAVVLFCVVLSAFIILQVIVYMVWGYLIPGFVLNMKLNDGDFTGYQLYSHYLEYARIAGYLKPNGFLCEPAHCAQCFFVSILILLFGPVKEKNDLKLALFISVGMILTMSTSAMLYLAFAWGVWSFKESKRNFLKIITIVIIVSILGYLGLKNGKLDNLVSVINRFTQTLEGAHITNSSQLRMLRGFQIFFALPLICQFFGIGFGNYSAAMSLISSNVNISMLNNEYMNTVSYILVSSGFVGFLILSLFFINLYKNGSSFKRIMVLALLLISLGSSIYSSPICVWLMLLILYPGKTDWCKQW